jgi:hypothetical protein
MFGFAGDVAVTAGQWWWVKNSRRARAASPPQPLTLIPSPGRGEETRSASGKLAVRAAAFKLSWTVGSFIP